MSSALASLGGRPVACVLVAASVGGGCDPVELESEQVGDPEEIRLKVLAAAEFSALSEDEPVPSMVVPDTMIRVLVSQEFAEDYAQIDPESDGSEIVLPPNALVIRQLIGLDGEPGGYTMLTMGEPMSNEDAGDLWFGALDADGEWKLDDDGQPMYGAIASCSGCHAQRPADGFLFGLPRGYEP